MTSQHQLRRRHALQLMAGATGAALLHACGQSSGSQMSLSLGTIPWVGQVPLYVAQEKGFYTEAGLDFSLKVFSSNGEYMAAFLANQVDSISPVSSEAVVLKSQGKDFKITMVQDNSVGGDGILARDSITRIEDFKGQKIAVDTSGVSYFFLLQILEEVGLSKADITAVNTDPTAAAAAFQSGSVDIAVTYAPYLQQTADAVKDGRIIYDSSKMPTAITDLYLFDTAYIESNPAAVQAFTNATLRGLQFLQDNRQEALEIGAAELEISTEDLDKDLKGVKLPDQATNLEMLSDPSSDLYLAKSLQDLSAFLLAEEQIEAAPTDIAALLDPQFVEAATF